MSDLALKQTSNLNYDLDFDGHDLVLSESLGNSVVMSLMEFDREKKPKSAEIDTVFGGWWGNALESYNLGSKLWLSLREGITETSLRNACDAVKDALKWMLDDGVAKSVEATAKRNSSDPYLVEFTVTITKPDGSEEPYQWQVNWRATA